VVLVCSPHNPRHLFLGHALDARLIRRNNLRVSLGGGNPGKGQRQKDDQGNGGAGSLPRLQLSSGALAQWKSRQATTGICPLQASEREIRCVELKSGGQTIVKIKVAIDGPRRLGSIRPAADANPQPNNGPRYQNARR